MKHQTSILIQSVNPTNIQSYYYNKQIFHAFLFNIRNCSSKVIDIQWRKAELNIVLPWVNNLDIKQKKTWNICFIICHQHINDFLKSLTHEKINRICIFLTWNWQLIRDWCKIKQENMIHIYAITIIDDTGLQKFPVREFHLGKITRNYYTPVRCYHVILVII